MNCFLLPNFPGDLLNRANNAVRSMAIATAFTFAIVPGAQAADIVVAWCGGAVGDWTDGPWGVLTFSCDNFNPVPPNNGGGDSYTVGIDSYDDPLTGPGLDRNGFPLNTAQPSTVHLNTNATISDLVIGTTGDVAVAGASFSGSGDTYSVEVSWVERQFDDTDLSDGSATRSVVRESIRLTTVVTP